MNEETAITNHFQKQDARFNDQASLLHHVQVEFDRYVQTLRNSGIRVIVIEDRPEVVTPDSIFPNNWIASDDQGNVYLFPMCAPNRRLERRLDVIDRFRAAGFRVNSVIELAFSEGSSKFLEGTGSMILDRMNRIAYCALSPRSDRDLLLGFCERLKWKAVAIRALQTIPHSGERAEIYHTNVMFTLAESFAVVCLDCIDDKKERNDVVEVLISSGKEIIEISEEQVACFAGNMLQVCNESKERFLVMSKSAYDCLHDSQRDQIRKHCKIISVDISIIEKLGGGSARCMLAEVFLPSI